jgi:hypothetical protein
MRLLAPLLTMLALLLAGISLIASLALSRAASVAPRPAPDAAEVRAARGAALELVLVFMGDGTPRRVVVDARQLDALAALAAHGLPGTRADIDLGDGRAGLTLSRRLASRTWVNIAAVVRPSGPGFPDVALRIGSLPLPERTARLGVELVRRWSAREGVTLPPVDAMVGDVRITPRLAAARVALPRSGVRLVRRWFGSGGEAVPLDEVRAVYGRLLALGAANPAPDLATHVRRAFSTPAVADNRAVFVALAMYAVDPRARRLVESLGIIPPCLPTPPVVRLAGRDDLAKHWALSAALASAVDPQFGRAMGEWKELDDSLPGGSGFSFVDLAADRAGLRAARRAADPATAAAMRERLGRAGDGDLLPRSVLALPEGLTEAQFAARYRSLDAVAYAAAVRTIDARLAATPLLRP